MLRNDDKARVQKDRARRSTVNASPVRESAGSLRHEALEKVDREVLLAIVTELSTERAASRSVARGKADTAAETPPPAPRDDEVSTVQAEAVEWYRSAAAQVEAEALHTFDIPGDGDSLAQEKLQHEFLVHMWYVLAQMWRDLAATSGNLAIAERSVRASLPVLDRSPEA
jgi:hypothetical protein